MNYHLLKMICLFFLFSCTGRNSPNHDDTLNKKEADTNGTSKMGRAVSDSDSKKADTAAGVKKETITLTSDTTWFPFSDSSYRLSVHIFNTEASTEDEINSVITYYHVKDGKSKQIFQDSFYCMDNGLMERKDFNNDQIEDILIFCYSGARANPSYHLFLADTVRHKLTYVKGFEELPNPDFDTAYNLIYSIALSGSNSYRFYQIDSKNKLISLGHGFDEGYDDSTQFERAIRKILKDRQKREALKSAK